MSDSVRRVEMVVSGVVQGVGFRQAAVSAARRLGLAGRVRNHADGSVSVVAEGPRVPAEQFRDWVKAGPPGARVKKVSEKWPPATGEFDDFQIAY